MFLTFGLMVLFSREHIRFLPFWLALFLLLVRCTPYQAERDYHTVILGEWIGDDRYFRAGDSVSILSSTDNCGFRFDGELCYLPCGFRDGLSYREGQFIDLSPGYPSPYLIEADTLSIWDKYGESWKRYVIRRLDQDSLWIETYRGHQSRDGWIWKYGRPTVQEDIVFDEVFVARYTTQPYDDILLLDHVFYLDRTGYYGHYSTHEPVGISNTKLEIRKLENSQITTLFKNFQYIDTKSFTDRYLNARTGSSVNRVISLYSQGALVRRIYIENGIGPDVLTRGYLPLESLTFLPWEDNVIGQGNEYDNIARCIRDEYLRGGKYLGFNSFKDC